MNLEKLDTNIEYTWHYLKLWDSWSVRLGPHSDPPVFYIHPRLHGHLQRGLSRKPECCKWCCFSFILIASAENSLQINPLSLCFKGTVSKYKLGVSNPGLVFDVFVEFERLFSLDDVLLALRFFYLWSSKSSLLVLCPLVVSYALFKRSRDGVVGFGCRVLMKLLWLRKCHDSR